MKQGETKRKRPQDKRKSAWWKKRNEARSVLQAQYAKAQEKAESES